MMKRQIQKDHTDFETYRNTAFVMLRLIAEAIDPEGVPAAPFDPADAPALYEVSKKHCLCALTASALHDKGIRLDDFEEAYVKAIRFGLLTEREFAAVSRGLSEKQIHYLPLKGVLLRGLYPKRWQREMTDVDILIEEGAHEAARDVMLQNGYTCTYYGKNNEDVYRKPPFFTFEIHRTLFDREGCKTLQTYFDGVTYAADERSPYLWQMNVDDTYVYLIAHVYMHFTAKGTGLRSLLDLHLYLKRYADEMDFFYIAGELKQFGADEFEKKIRRLCRQFLKPGQLTDEDRKLLDRFIFSGVYGSKKQYVKNQIAAATDGSARSKAQYIKSRFAVTDRMISDYPFYQKHPRLKPLFGAKRFAKAVFTKPRAILSEVAVLSSEKKKSNPDSKKG